MESKDRRQPLTDRELEILHLILRGLSNHEIAQELVISLNTVKWHTREIYSRLGVSSRTQALATARSLGLLEPTTTAPPVPSWNELPSPTTPFIGREGELRALDGLLDDPNNRLVTILGPGGIGKTRLALATAARRHDSEPGLRFIRLEGLTSAEQVIAAVGQAVNFQFGGRGDPELQLLTSLRSSDLLLILDNFEHLLDVAPLLTEILAAGPGIRLLTTSRERLNLHGEVVLALDGLSYPAEDFDITVFSAVQLFLQAAQRRQYDFTPGTHDLLHIARICRLVEGLPLALEIAAGWIDVLSPDQIADQIEQDLNILQTQWRDTPDRHRSMRAVFDHSWQLLTDEERSAFKALSVFRGGFDSVMAEQIAGTSLFMLSTLIDKTLVARVSARRYRLHELLRQFADEKLAADPDNYRRIGDKHCWYYADLLQEMEAGTKTDVSASAAHLVRLSEDEKNITAGWQWALQQGLAEAIGQYAFMLSLFYAVCGLAPFAETTFRLASDRLRAQSTGVSRLTLMRVLTHHGWFCWSQNDVVRARQVLEEARELVSHLEDGHEPDISILLSFLAGVIHAQGEVAAAVRLLQQALELARRSGYQHGILNSLCELGVVEFQQRREQAACDFYQLVIVEAEDNALFVALGLSLLGNAQAALGDFGAAKGSLRQALEMCRDIYMPALLLTAIIGIAGLLWRQDRVQDALTILAIVLNHPQCGQIAVAQSVYWMAECETRLTEQAITEVMEKARSNQLETPYFESSFTIDSGFMDQVQALLEQM